MRRDWRKRSFWMLAVPASIVWLALFWCFPTAHAGPPPLEVYGALPKTEDLALSPNGKLVALINTVSDKRMLSVAEVDGAPLVTVEIGDAKIWGLQWACDDNVVVYSHRTAWLGGNPRPEEFSQGAVLKPSLKKLDPLLRPSSSYLSALFGRYGYAQVDGHCYGYYGVIPMGASNDTNDKAGFYKQRYPDLYRIDLDTGDINPIARGNSASPRWVIDSSGHIVAESEYKSGSGAWTIYRPQSPSVAIASGHSDFGFGLLGLGRSPGTVLVGIEGLDEGISELRLDNGQMDPFLPAGQVLDLAFSTVTRQLLSAQIEGEGDPILAYDPILDRHLQSIRKAFPGKYLKLASASSDLNRVVVKVTGGDVTGTWQMVDFSAKKAMPLADAYSGIPDGMVGEVKEISYKAADGLTIPAILTLPPGRAAHGLPLLVFPHGGPEAVDRPGFDWIAQAFASRGYVVLQPNFRGSDGYGEKFRNAGFGEWGRKMQTDVSDGIGFLAAQGIVDPKRVCIVGASYGGYAAMAGVTLQHGLYRCAASYGGVSDPVAQLHYAREWAGLEYEASMTRYWEKYLGPSDGNALDAVTPEKNAAQADAPVLLVHGVRDTVVPIHQSEDMDSALRKAGKQVELIRLDGEDHWLSHSATRLQALKAMVNFVEKYNPPDGPGDQIVGH